jgi:hypothetical protein
MTPVTLSHVQGAWCHSIPLEERLSEEARVGKPQAGFCEGEAHNGAGSNSVTLPGPKGGSNGAYKPDLHTGSVLSTRPQTPPCCRKFMQLTTAGGTWVESRFPQED